MMKTLFILTLFFFVSLTYAQTSQMHQDLQKAIEDMQKQMREQFEKDHKQMEKMLQGGVFKEFERMFKQIENDESFDQIRKALEGMGHTGGFGFGGGLGEEDFEWKENANERTLILKVQIKKDAPFDIKIEDGQIKIKGSFEKRTVSTDPRTGASSESIQQSSFSRSFQVPRDTDPGKVRFEQLENGIHIIFPKKSAKRPKNIKKESSRPKLKPIAPKKGDMNI